MAINNIRTARKIEIAITMPDGTVTAFREDDIIRCVVSLRGDLSPINPTLPESEIEADIYAEDVMGAVIADLPDETAITYKTGSKTSQYWDSPTRYFYMDSASWENNILHIHARDQVHKLDEEIAPLYIGQKWEGQANNAVSKSLQYLAWSMRDIIDGTPEGYGNIEHFSYQSPSNYEGTSASGDQVNSLLERGTRREMIAKMMNICRFDFPENFLQSNYYHDSFRFTYVDAGSPLFYLEKDYWNAVTINEEDCGDIKEEREKNIEQYNFKIADILQLSGETVIPPGSSYWTQTIKAEGCSGVVKKQKYISLEYSGLIDKFYVAMTTGDNSYISIWAKTTKETGIARSRPYNTQFGVGDSWKTWLQEHKYGMWLIDEDVSNNALNNTKFDFVNLSGNRWYDKETSWYINGVEQTVAQMWQYLITNGYLAANAESATFDIHAVAHTVTDDTIKKVRTGRNGTVEEVDGLAWIGEMYAINYNTPRERIKILPDMGLNQIARRPTMTGSFVHRNIPILQPWAHINFYFIEKILTDENEMTLTDENGNELKIGGYEKRTVETITTTHERGGSISEITYRRGDL